MRYREKTTVCVDLLDPDEETFRRALNFINEGEMIRCVTVVEGREMEKAMMFHYVPRVLPYTGEEYQSWIAAKDRAQKIN